MNKTYLIIGVVVLILVGGGIFFGNQQSSSTQEAKMAQEKAAMAEKEAMKAKADEVMEKKEDNKIMTDKSSSRYVEYSKTTLDQAGSNRRVLFFYANWCPICRPADADFTANANTIPADVTVIRVNYNDTDTDQEEKDLAKKYGITYQHTYVQIDATGKEATKWNGGQISELLSNIK